MEEVPLKLRERFRRLTLWNKIGVMGAAASIVGCIVGIPLAVILFQLQERYQPPPIVTTELAAFEKLHEGKFADAAVLFERALAIAPSNSRLWEGNAYAHLGLLYPDTFDLNTVWGNFNLKPTILGGDLSLALSCSQRAAEHASNNEELIHANLVLGLVLELAGYDDYGATRHGLSPLYYYVEASKLVSTLDPQPKLPRSIAAIKYTPYSEVVDFAVENRLRKRYDTNTCERFLKSYFSDRPELLQRYREACDD